MRDIRVATVQFQHAPSDKAYNLGRVRHWAAEAARQGVELIAFPEMCLTGYWHVRNLSREAFEALAEPVLAHRLVLDAAESIQPISVDTTSGRADAALLNATVKYSLETTDGRKVLAGTARGNATYERDQQR